MIKSERYQNIILAWELNLKSMIVMVPMIAVLWTNPMSLELWLKELDTWSRDEIVKTLAVVEWVLRQEMKVWEGVLLLDYHLKLPNTLCKYVSAWVIVIMIMCCSFPVIYCIKNSNFLLDSSQNPRDDEQCFGVWNLIWFCCNHSIVFGLFSS